ncbi:MAG: methylenetetrahydrofolate--tRNA-(uracil(54)-C(5))-methyltransferase (FADH(2)-oxidizing) TrmFO [Syntrophomonadaceae bacterium]|nr:methylenetetrahydrofolate--tRNA-(uracil(54)-C(5))-methyltransferase (FADH(2)-oxidizing) TrmFO [Syntrophomonadaceae bacterium]
MSVVNVIGGGLAGCEAAHRIAAEGIRVKLWEMRPQKPSPVHETGNLSELVCSNSLKSDIQGTAQGLLKAEMRILGSLLLDCAEQTRVPAGSALAVDRLKFSQLVTDRIEANTLIEVIREEVLTIPAGEVSIIATGPLTSEKFWQHLQNITGSNLYFFDAVAPSVTAASLNREKVFKASRYGKGSDDYYNCPLQKEEYEHFYEQLVAADIKEGHAIDNIPFFSACTPIEVMARRGIDTLRFGPMRPVGLEIPGDDSRPYAVLQLRQEDKEGRIYGLVGFQTRLRWGEQDRVFRLIPGLENAEFVRYGVMHRNSYINSPRLLNSTLQLKDNPKIFFAGQITGVEGYMESAAAGIIAGINAVRFLNGQSLLTPEPVTMLGALLTFISSAREDIFQPINANFGLLPPLEKNERNKKLRYEKYSERALNSMIEFSELLPGMLNFK